SNIKPGLLDRLRNFIFIDFLYPTNKIREVSLPGLDNRVDRCTTCHQAIDRQGFEQVDFPGLKKEPRRGFDNQGLPFTTHSRYDLIIKNHPPETFGCTACHQGQGRATDSKSAKGDVPHWEEPLLPAKFVESSCAKCHVGSGELEGAKSLSLGKKLFVERGCFACHAIDREGFREIAKGSLGPPLTSFGSKRVEDLQWGEVTDVPRTKWDWHFAFVKEPELFNPETQMTNYGLTDEEAEALTNFVLGLVDEEVGSRYLVRPKVEKANSSSQPVKSKTGDVTAKGSSPGRELFLERGCIACHTIDREGLREVANGTVGPPLTFFGSKGVDELEWGEVTDIPRTKRDWVVAYIKDPARFKPDTLMSDYGLTDEEIDALADFMLGLVK
ncbi:MAG: c-type cytochrome, partial [Nitrospinota bacterium]